MMILDQIVAAKKERLQDQKRETSLPHMRRLAEETRIHPADFCAALQTAEISIIGEFKKASPSMGIIDNKLNLRERIAQYNESVDAISCLTEESYFHGSVDDFVKVRRLTPLPMLRKDFMIEEYQFYEARAMSANAVLLIAAILEDERLQAFYQLTEELGLTSLIEVHNEREMERVLRLDPDIVGVNNRDLKDFTIRLETTGRLARLLPKTGAGRPVLVAESGVISDQDVAYLKEQGADAFLIGRALMESEHPKELARRWKSI